MRPGPSAVRSAALTPVSVASPKASAEAGTISNFTLANGLAVVVIPDHRAPVVTHMLWYKNGSADDPPGKSGIAHFLEHLMFKGTKNNPIGTFSNIVAELGGQENAFTYYDFTAYFQRVATEHLGRMMELEADRMTGLVLSDEIVAPERDVVLEERRMRVDGDPSAQLAEAVDTTLFVHHPYGQPVIGWEHEIESFGRADALAYYERFYTPENAILVVAGDVRGRGRKGAGEGDLRPGAGARRGTQAPAPARAGPQGATPRQARRRQGAPAQSAPRLSRPLLCQQCQGRGSARSAGPCRRRRQTSQLYMRLVREQKLAVSVGAHFLGHSLDDTRFMLYAIPAEGVTLETLDTAVEAVVADIALHGVPAEDLARAKTRLVADAVYAQDNQSSLAQWYGAALTTGLSVEDVQQWPNRIDAVSVEDITEAARQHLVKRRSVTGYLLPEAAALPAATA